MIIFQIDPYIFASIDNFSVCLLFVFLNIVAPDLVYVEDKRYDNEGKLSASTDVIY